MRGHPCWYRKKFVGLMTCAGSTVVVGCCFLQKEVSGVDQMRGVSEVFCCCFYTKRSL